MFKIVFLLLLSVCANILYAQTDYEIKMAELRARREMAKEAIGEGGDDKLLALEADAQVYKAPCTLYDDEEWYTASNRKAGNQGDSELKLALLKECQHQLKSKIGGRVQQALRDYSDQMRTEEGSYFRLHIESIGELVVDKEIGDTQEYCAEETKPDSEGNIVMYMSIRVKKKTIVDNIITEVANSPQEKEGEKDAASSKTISSSKMNQVRQNEQKLRDILNEKFKEDK